MSRRVVTTDASFWPEGGIAGLAGVLSHREVRVLFQDVARCPSAPVAEMLAVLRAMQIAQDSGWGSVEFRTDAEGVAVALNRNRMGAELVRPALDECRRLMALHLAPPADRHNGWVVVAVPRKWAAPAHVAAGQAMKLWRSGKAGRPTLSPPTAAGSVGSAPREAAG